MWKVTNYERIHCKPQNSLIMAKHQKQPLELFCKRDSGTGFFLWILRNFWEHFFLHNMSDGCFWSINFLTCFLHKVSKCSLMFRFLSILIPKSYSHLLRVVAFFIDIYFPGVITRQKNFILLLLNQFKSLLPKTSKLCATYPEFPPVSEGVVSSA